jgi:hypothetical protein
MTLGKGGSPLQPAGSFEKGPLPLPSVASRITKESTIMRLNASVTLLALGLGASAITISCAGGTESSAAQEPSGKTDGSGKLTVFAADPDYGVYGMYREGSEYVFYHLKSASQSGRVAASAEFFDKRMSSIALSRDDAPALLAASGEGVSGSQQALMAAAAVALDNELDHEAFLSERSALASFHDLGSADQHAVAALAAAVTPAMKAMATENYFRGLQKDLTWKSGTNGNDLVGRYRGTTFHADFNIVTDENGDPHNPGQSRIERNARIATANGINIIVQLGGDELPEGYTQGPEDAGYFSKESSHIIENFENHHRILGEGFMAGRVIQSTAAFPQAEKEIFARMSAHLSERLLPLAGEEIASSTTVYKSWLELDNQCNYIPGTHICSGTQHSATLTNFFLNGSYRGGTFYCNHGACVMNYYDDGSGHMDYGCDTGFITTYDHWNIPPYIKLAENKYHTCSTPYYLLGTKSDTHVCNDDSRTQVRAVLRLGFCTGAGGSYCYNWLPYSVVCSDSAPNPRAPGCDG